MDTLDLAILKLLISDGRASYNSIASRIGISTSSVISRVNNMIREGVIDRFLARVNLEQLGYRVIYIIVKHDGNEDELVRRLGSIGYIFMVVTCIGDYSIVALAVDPRLSNSNYTKLLEHIRQYRIIYISSALEASKRLTYNDLRIIKVLARNARAKVKDIAKETRVSIKTVERRISKMVNERIISFTAIINPTVIKGFINFIMIIKVSAPTRVEDVLGNNLLMPVIHAASDMLVAVLHAYSTDELDAMLRRVKMLDNVKDVELFIVQRIIHDDYSKIIDEIIAERQKD